MSEMDVNESVVRKLLDVVDAGLTSGLGNQIPGQMCVEAAVCFALGLPHGDKPQCVAPALRSLKIRLNDASWSSNETRAKGLRRLAVAQLGSAATLDEKEFVRRVVDYALTKSVPLALRYAASIHRDPKHKQVLLGAASRCEHDASTKAALEAKKTAAASAAAVDAAAYASAAYAVDAAAYASAAYAADAAAYAASAASAAAVDAAAYAADAAAYAAYAAAAAAAAYAADAAADAAGGSGDEALSSYAEDIVQILIEMKAPGCQWLPLTEQML